MTKKQVKTKINKAIYIKTVMVVACMTIIALCMTIIATTQTNNQIKASAEDTYSATTTYLSTASTLVNTSQTNQLTSTNPLAASTNSPCENCTADCICDNCNYCINYYCINCCDSTPPKFHSIEVKFSRFAFYDNDTCFDYFKSILKNENIHFITLQLENDDIALNLSWVTLKFNTDAVSVMVAPFSFFYEGGTALMLEYNEWTIYSLSFSFLVSGGACVCDYPYYDCQTNACLFEIVSGNSAIGFRIIELEICDTSLQNCEDDKDCEDNENRPTWHFVIGGAVSLLIIILIAMGIVKLIKRIRGK